MWDDTLSRTSKQDRQLLTLMQSSFPLDVDPFGLLGAEVHLSSEQVRSRITEYRRAGILRALQGVFDTSRLGYYSTLVAAKVSQTAMDQVAARINAHASVSHNYVRRHAYNLWFTLTVPQAMSLEQVVADMLHGIEVGGYLILPALRVFKIGVHFDLLRGEANVGANHWRGEVWSPAALSGRDRSAVRALQEDLPDSDCPFDDLARGHGMTGAELLERAQALRANGALRRYGALLRHRRAGFSANGMVCWRVPERDIERVGQIVAGFPAVSHCYQRPTFPDWPYALFSMIHAREECIVEETALEIARAASLTQWEILYSEKELKKESVRFFLDASEDMWDAPESLPDLGRVR